MAFFSHMFWKDTIIFLKSVEWERFDLQFHKCNHLSFLGQPSNWFQLAYSYVLEANYFVQFDMRHPVIIPFFSNISIFSLSLQIAVVAVMCKPHRCPHINMTGNICVYCPGGPDSDFEYSTQSYTGEDFLINGHLFYRILHFYFIT